MEFVELQRVGAEVNLVIRRTGGRRGQAVPVRGEQSADCGALLKTHLRCGGSGQHGSAVVSAGVRAHERVAVEHVERDVVAVGPDAHFRVVVEIRVLKRIAVVGAGGIGGGGNGHALKEGCGRDRKLADDPAVGRLVIEGDAVAVVVSLATAAETGPEGVGRGWPGNQRAGGLVEDSERRVHQLEILGRAYGAVGVRGRAIHGKAILRVA